MVTASNPVQWARVFGRIAAGGAGSSPFVQLTSWQKVQAQVQPSHSGTSLTVVPGLGREETADPGASGIGDDLRARGAAEPLAVNVG